MAAIARPLRGISRGRRRCSGQGSGSRGDSARPARSRVRQEDSEGELCIPTSNNREHHRNVSRSQQFCRSFFFLNQLFLLTMIYLAWLYVMVGRANRKKKGVKEEDRRETSRSAKIVAKAAEAQAHGQPAHKKRRSPHIAETCLVLDSRTPCILPFPFTLSYPSSCYLRTCSKKQRGRLR